MSAYGGQMSRSRELVERAVENIKRTGSKEGASAWLSEMALNEALMGNLFLARSEADSGGASRTPPTFSFIICR